MLRADSLERMLLRLGQTDRRARATREGEDMARNINEIEVDYDFQGGITVAASGVKNGLLAAIEIGLVDKSDATEILLLIREATERLIGDIET